MDGDRQGNGQYAAPPAPPPRAEDRVAVPAGPPPAQDAIESPGRRFARPGSPGPALSPPPRPSQAADTMFMPPPRATDRVTAPMPPVVLPPPDPAQRLGAAAFPPLAAFPPPLAEHRIGPEPEPRRRILRRGPPWLGPALLAAAGVLLIGAGIGFGAHAIFGGSDSNKKQTTTGKVALPTRPTRPVPLTPPAPNATPSHPSGPATVGPGVTAPGAGGKAGKTQNAPSIGTTTSPAPATGGGAASVSSWPSGKTAWTVVLASTTSKSAAEAKAKQASGRGISAGVLNSNDFSSLRHGYWVAFAGQYGSSSDAASAAKRDASQGFGGAYARFVKP